MSQYDYLIVGAGLFGATFAHQARKAGKTCLVIDRRAHKGTLIAGKKRASTYMLTEPISFIRMIRISGTL